MDHFVLKNPAEGHENVIWFLEKAYELLQKGKITADRYRSYEMIELGYNPSSDSDIKKYYDYVEKLQIDLDMKSDEIKKKLRELGLPDIDIGNENDDS